MTNSVALEAVRYDAASGLVPVVVQDAATGSLLMQAYANRETLKRTLQTGQAWFWSRSRQEYWRKGSTSGNTMQVLDVRLDCDGDAVLYVVNAAGPACHTGETSCFYRSVSYQGERVAQAETTPTAAAGDETTAARAQDVSDAVPGGDAALGAELASLWSTVVARDDGRPSGSYTTYLFTQGIDQIAKKVGEEAVEVALEAKNVERDAASRDNLAKESADLLYHLLVLWQASGVTPADVAAVLRGRKG